MDEGSGGEWKSWPDAAAAARAGLAEVCGCICACFACGRASVRASVRACARAHVCVCVCVLAPPFTGQRPGTQARMAHTCMHIICMHELA